MTIHKSQGQTLSKVGIYLNAPCLAHDQLHVALSRARSFDDVHVTITHTSEQGKHRQRYYTKKYHHQASSFPNVIISYYNFGKLTYL